MRLIYICLVGCIALSQAFAPCRTTKTTTTISNTIDTAGPLSTRPTLIKNMHTTRLFSAAIPQQEGQLLKTIAQEGSGPTLKLGDIATVKYSCYVVNEKTPFARSSKQKLAIGDGSMIPGWDQALRQMRVGERSIVRVPPSLGYGEKGIPGLVPANAQLELDVQVLDAQAANTNIDFDSLANADNTPRTAADIQAAYEARQAAKANVPKKEGLEAWIDKAKNFYFYGLFEGETGERPPWFLRPSITFPLAFLIVGAAFYVSLASGAISERGAQVTDELDEIILSSNQIMSIVTLAMSSSVDF